MTHGERRDPPARRVHESAGSHAHPGCDPRGCSRASGVGRAVMRTEETLDA
jgi:hypothetical protein